MSDQVEPAVLRLNAGLGPLPEPDAWRTQTGPWGDRSTDYAYSANAMEAERQRCYAAGGAAERERCAKIEAALWTAIHTLERDGDEWNVCEHLRAAFRA